MTEPRLVIENFVDTMTQLMELLTAETNILNNNNYNELEPIQTRKLHLSKAYEDAQRKLQEQQNSLDCLSEDERQDLRDLYLSLIHISEPTRPY